ncbi:hypothetical protein SNE25_11980 [Mucilaginibacter sabulilitoris]|uniref:DUF1735 domain-containing protein n=1 Tax=Mucilaginibacter sabulilitoris TaxID=1173583 RepID=A0ABZ0TTK3_9SPHI|nr:hypothetical protein [Mucilaginibacter sabulilitoris]WPU96237.1 hypothetical protein SNE25_11980 [Mucilaginibacter sabulilitoris]
MKYITLAAIIALCITACRKDDQNFKLKTITINAYTKKDLPLQRIYVRIVDAADTQRIIGISAAYPSNLPLPVTLGVTSAMKQALYKNTCRVLLYGDSTGLLSSQKMNMDNYKIIFPLEMDVKNEDMDITLSGSWD